MSDTFRESAPVIISDLERLVARSLAPSGALLALDTAPDHASLAEARLTRKLRRPRLGATVFSKTRLGFFEDSRGQLVVFYRSRGSFDSS